MRYGIQFIGEKNEYIFESAFGGNLTVNNIEIDDENISLYYEKNGIIDPDIRMVIRDKTKGYNYTCPNYISKKGLNGETNVIKFAINSVARAGTSNFSDDISDAIENIEFTAFFGIRYNYIGDYIDIEIPIQDNNINEFEEFKILDLKESKYYNNIYNED